jgi:hypothetical protein
MDHVKAFEILELDFGERRYGDVTLTLLKGQYRKLALRHHPDKNGNTIESNERFKHINEAYHFLKKELQGEEEPVEEEESRDDCINGFLYWQILKNFVRGIFEASDTADLVMKIVQDLLITGKQISVKLFDDLDKDTFLNIYTFLSTHKTTLHLSNELLDTIRQMVLDKYETVEIYKLNPSIHDLLENNLYKLYIDEQLYLVPLWHSESHFDKEIIVICEPELPPNMSIDDDNNLYIEAELYGNELVDQILYDGSLCLNIGPKTLSIPLSSLYMKQHQTYRFKKEGISKVKKDIYDVSDKSDIIVNITVI